MELRVQVSDCIYVRGRLGSQFRSIMKRALTATILTTILAGAAVAQIPPTDRRMICLDPFSSPHNKTTS